MSEYAKIITEGSKKVIITDLCNSIYKKRHESHSTQNNYITREFIASLVTSMIPVYSWIDRHVIPNEYSGRLKRTLFTTTLLL